MPRRGLRRGLTPVVRTAWQESELACHVTECPRQIRTAAPASGGRLRAALLALIAPTSFYLLGSRVTSDALDDLVRASLVAILLPRQCIVLVGAPLLGQSNFWGRGPF